MHINTFWHELSDDTRGDLVGSLVGIVGLVVDFSVLRFGGAKFASLSSSVCFLLNPYNIYLHNIICT